MSQNNDDTFLARWLNNELSEEERREFESDKDYSQYQKIIAASDHILSEKFDTEKILDRVKSSKSQEEERKLRLTKRKNTLTWVSGIAAAIALLVIVFGLPDRETTISTSFGEQQTAYLPDGSEIQLNAQSKIQYHADEWSKDRSMELIGEAYFKVAKGKKFTVHTDLGQVAVLGTQFNVQVIDELFIVTCFEGKVEVTTENDQHILRAGDSYRLISGRTQLVQEEGLVPGWTKKNSIFKSVPVKFVLKALENQYNIEFEGNQLDSNLTYTGGFPHYDLTTALKVVLGGLQIDYEIKDNKVFLIQ